VIFYNPLDGDAITSTIPSQPRTCFLITRLGKPRPLAIDGIRKAVVDCCEEMDYKVIDASTQISGRDFLLKIWKMIAATPFSVGIAHEGIPPITQANIFYELGVAQALGKETLIIKSEYADVPSDFIRTEYITFNRQFKKNFKKYLQNLNKQADHYEIVADQLDRNPILALDYLKRAYLIKGDDNFKKKAKQVLSSAGVKDRAKNSVEQLAATF